MILLNSKLLSISIFTTLFSTNTFKSCIRSLSIFKAVLNSLILLLIKIIASKIYINLN